MKKKTTPPAKVPADGTKNQSHLELRDRIFEGHFFARTPKLRAHVMEPKKFFEWLHTLADPVLGLQAVLRDHERYGCVQEGQLWLALVGTSDDPAEWLPRDATWHQERCNWQAEVDSLRKVNHDLATNLETSRRTIAARDEEIRVRKQVQESHASNQVAWMKHNRELKSGVEQLTLQLEVSKHDIDSLKASNKELQRSLQLNMDSAAQLRTEIQLRKQITETLEREVNQLRSSTNQKTAEPAPTHPPAVELQATIACLQKELQATKVLVYQRDAKILDRDEKLADLTLKHETQQTQLTKANAALQEWTETYTGATCKIAELERTCAELRQFLDQRDAAIKELKDTIERRDTALNKAEQVIKDERELRYQMSQQATDERALRQQMTSRVQELEKLHGQVLVELNMTQEAHGNQAATIGQLQKEKAALGLKPAAPMPEDLEQTMASMQQHIGELEEQLREHLQARNAMATIITEKELKITSMTQDMRMLQAHLNEAKVPSTEMITLSNECQELRGQVSLREGQLAQQETVLRQLHEELKTAKEELGRKHDRLKGMENSLHEMTVVLDRRDEIINSQAKNLLRLEKEAEALRKNIEQLKQENLERSQSAHRIVQENEQLTLKIRDLEQQLESSAARNAKLIRQLLTVRGALEGIADQP